MSIKTWDLIKRSKEFYIRTYRSVEKVIFVSVLINLFLMAGIIYNYSKIPEPDYYATFGETPPVPLIAMDSPNFSAQPLLADDSNQDTDVRAIPQ